MKYFAGITLLALSVAALPAQAYVLPTDYIVRLMLDAQAKHKISDATIKLRANLKGDPNTQSERLYIKSPERLRLVGEGETETLYIENEGARAEGTPKSLSPLKTLPTDLLTALKFPKGKKSDERIERLLSILAKVGIDTSVTTLGRFEGKPAYIIGALPFESNKPQVWIDKVRLQPLKTVLFTGAGATGQRIEHRFLDYDGSAAGTWFPGLVETWLGDELVKKQTISEARTNQNLPETLFQTR